SPASNDTTQPQLNPRTKKLPPPPPSRKPKATVPVRKRSPRSLACYKRCLAVQRLQLAPRLRLGRRRRRAQRADQRTLPRDVVAVERVGEVHVRVIGIEDVDVVERNAHHVGTASAGGRAHRLLLVDLEERTVVLERAIQRRRTRERSRNLDLDVA